MFGREDITREILGNVPGWIVSCFYLLAMIACGCAAWGFWQRHQRRRQGSPSAPESTRPWRWHAFAETLLFQREIRRDPFAGTAHLLVTYGFLILFWGTCLVFLEHDTPLHFFYGWFYQAASLIIDLGGLSFLAGLGMFLWRRHFVERTPILKEWWVASLTWLLFAIGVSGFLLEGARIAADFPAHERWSVVGYSLAVMIRSAGLTGDSVLGWHRGLWISHAVLCTAFFALLPWQFFAHLVYGPASWAKRSPRPLSVLPLLEPDAVPGVRHWANFSANDLLQTDACTTCGRCVEVCPANAAGKPLQPRSVVLGIRSAMDSGFAWKPSLGFDQPGFNDEEEDTANEGLSQVMNKTAGKRSPPLPGPLPRSGGEGTNRNASVELSEYVLDAALWSCTTCAACNSVCPVGIDIYGKIVELRRGRVEAGVVPEPAEQLFESVAEKSNPFGRSNADRMNWARGLDVPVAEENEPVELLYWVGCAGSFDPDGQSVAKSMIKVLNHLGVNYRVLGCRERCTGDPARRLGEEGLFREQVDHVQRTFRSHGVKKILTHCPHCWNTFRNESPTRDGEGPPWTVQHHTEFLAEQIVAGKLAPPKLPAEKITYHDPCYLGRGNGVTEPPRAVLKQLQPLPILEMPRNREQSFCCGAGGGAMWVDVPGTTRVEHLRAQEAAQTGASVVVTGCPFCKVMLRTGLEAASAGPVAVRDLSELVVTAEGL